MNSRSASSASIFSIPRRPMTRLRRSIRSAAQELPWRFNATQKKGIPIPSVSNGEGQNADRNLPPFPVRAIEDQNAFIDEREQSENQRHDRADVDREVGEKPASPAIGRFLLDLCLEGDGDLGQAYSSHGKESLNDLSQAVKTGLVPIEELG